MKKVILIIVSVAVLLLLSSCSNNNDEAACKCNDTYLPSGYAYSIVYEDDEWNSPSAGSYPQILKNVDFEYVNENTIKITKEDGNIIYIDSSRLYHINVIETILEKYEINKVNICQKRKTIKREIKI